MNSLKLEKADEASPDEKARYLAVYSASGKWQVIDTSNQCEVVFEDCSREKVLAKCGELNNLI